MKMQRSKTKHLSAVVGILLCSLPVLSADDKFEWVPAEAHKTSNNSFQAGFGAIPVVFTAIPKPTADASKFTREYVIDLKKFNISNDGTHPSETSSGINLALKDAQSSGANKILFPKGTYLISESDPVVITNQNTIIDLNGATLQINPNGQLKYEIVRILDGAQNLRLTNGTLKGDKESHDYKTIAGSHEWGMGLQLEGGRNLEIDHLTMTNVSGRGVSSRAGIPYKEPARCLNVSVKNLEQGGLTVSGEKEPNNQKTRTIKPYSLPVEEFLGEFEFGYIFGYMSYPSVMDRNYQSCFYDKDMKFIEKKTCLQFKKVLIPQGAKFLALEFNQPQVKEAAKHGFCGSIVNSRPPIDVHFHHNTMTGNRSLGFGFCGGQRWIIEENLFEGNGGVAPAYGIDFEDGWDFMQDIVFRNNHFKGNLQGDLVVCAGNELIFEGNDFEKNVIVYGRASNYTIVKNRIQGNVIYRSRTGIAKIQDNHYEYCGTFAITFDTKGNNDGLMHQPGEPVQTPPLSLEKETLVNVSKVIGTYFVLTDCKLQNVAFVAGKDTSLIHLKNCDVKDCSIVYEDKGPQVTVIFENCTGQIAESGAGIKRKKPGF